MKLLFENWRKYINEVAMGFDMAKSIEYTGFVLDKTSHQKLAQLAPEGESRGEWKVYAHHMTMIPPTDQKQRLPSEQFYEGCLTVVEIAQNEKVVAVKVDPSQLEELMLYFKIEGLPHITIATAIDPERTKDPKYPKYYSPTLSNEFGEQDYEPIETGPIEVCGKVEEILR